MLDVTAPVASRAGTLRGHLAALGKVRTQADILIAATAIDRGLTVATRNGRHFVDCGVAVFDPFAAG